MRAQYKNHSKQIARNSETEYRILDAQEQLYLIWMSPSKSDTFTNEFVITFGFLGGLFTRVGVDPETELIKALLTILEQFYPSMKVLNPWILILITADLTLASIVAIYSLVEKLGLLAVAFAWIGGFIAIGDSTQVIIGIILFGIALLMGKYAIERR